MTQKQKRISSRGNNPGEILFFCFVIIMTKGRNIKAFEKGGTIMNDIDYMNDDEIFSKVKTLMERIKKDQELQELSERNGLDVKNSIKLTNDTSKNIAISVISLMLAKRSNDPDYRKLTQMGMEKRSLKTGIINKYKNQANQLIAKYNSIESV